MVHLELRYVQELCPVIAKLWECGLSIDTSSPGFADPQVKARWEALTRHSGKAC